MVDATCFLQIQCLPHSAWSVDYIVYCLLLLSISSRGVCFPEYHVWQLANCLLFVLHHCAPWVCKKCGSKPGSVESVSSTGLCLSKEWSQVLRFPMQGLHTTTFHCPLPREAQRARAQEPCYLHLTGVGTQISMLPWLRIPRSKWQCHLDQNARHIAVRRRLVSWTQVTQVIQIRRSNHSPTWVVHSSAQFCAVLHSLGTEWHWGVDVLLVWPSLWSPGCSRPRVAQWCTVTVHRVHGESRGGHIGRCRLNGWGRVIATRRCRRRLWRARYFGCMTWVYTSNIEYTLSTTFWATGVTEQVANFDQRQFQPEFEFALSHRRPEIPLMRRMSLPMAMEHAKKMVNGESEP